MAEVPRIVRERLREQTVAGEHPDADLLSAFAERTLTEPERAQVLDHLSRCAECREVVALSTPQVEEEQLVAAAAPAGAQAAGRSWWRSPVVHWSALTAAALVVLIAVGERMRLREGYNASAPAIARIETKLEPAPAPAQPALQRQESRQQVEAAAPPRRTQAINRPGVAGGAVGGKIAADKSAAVTAPAAAPPPPPAEAKKLQSPATSDYSSGQAFDQARKIDQPQLKALPAPSAKAAPGVRSGGAVAGGPVSAPSGQSTMVTQFAAGNFVRRAFVGPRWTVSEAGVVQRSFDGGQSWKEVPIAEGVSFRAVAVVVNDVWAGGSGGALFHSTDGGQHWNRVQVQANDRTLTGNIVRIEFADAKNVVVTSSTGETWGTSNSGASWEQR